MSEELLNPQPGGVVIAHSLARMMLVQALRVHIADSARNSSGGLCALSDAQMSTAIACMQQEPALDWTVEKLANRAGMSRAGFALKFKETVGQTPIEYLTRWRMLLAEDRMAGTTDSIAEIARSLGYESASAFTKVFKKVTGHSPTPASPKPANSCEPRVALANGWDWRSRTFVLRRTTRESLLLFRGTSR